MTEGKVLQKQRLRRMEIVAAAQKCFAEKGLHGASVADIARQAGLSDPDSFFRPLLSCAAITSQTNYQHVR